MKIDDDNMQKAASALIDAIEARMANKPLAGVDIIATALQEERDGKWKFKLKDRVTKSKGSSWTGRIVGFYSTELTPVGYNVESENEPGSVQIYPESALSAAPQPPAVRKDEG